MRAIKIDCVKKEIYEIDLPHAEKEDYSSMYKELDAEGYEGVRMSKTEMLWVDEAGLRRKPPIGAFRVEWYPQALPGHGLIIGLKGEYNAATELTLEEVRAMVRFVDISELPFPVITVTSFEKMEDFLNYVKSGPERQASNEN